MSEKGGNRAYEGRLGKDGFRTVAVIPLRAKWPSPPGPVFRFSGAEFVSEATASLVSNIAEKRVCGKRVLSKLRPSKIALAVSNNSKVALQKVQLCFDQQKNSHRHVCRWYCIQLKIGHNFE